MCCACVSRNICNRKYEHGHFMAGLGTITLSVEVGDFLIDVFGDVWYSHGGPNVWPQFHGPNATRLCVCVGGGGGEEHCVCSGD
jgi:hypothetical protein